MSVTISVIYWLLRQCTQHKHTIISSDIWLLTSPKYSLKWWSTLHVLTTCFYLHWHTALCRGCWQLAAAGYVRPAVSYACSRLWLLQRPKEHRGLPLWWPAAQAGWLAPKMQVKVMLQDSRWHRRHKQYESPQAEVKLSDECRTCLRQHAKSLHIMKSLQHATHH